MRAPWMDNTRSWCFMSSNRSQYIECSHMCLVKHTLLLYSFPQMLQFMPPTDLLHVSSFSIVTIPWRLRLRSTTVPSLENLERCESFFKRLDLSSWSCWNVAVLILIQRKAACVFSETTKTTVSDDSRRVAAAGLLKRPYLSQSTLSPIAKIKWS